jgi:hypothetical protein
VNLTGAAKLTVELGYGTDVFTSGSGDNFWSRPVDTAVAPIQIRITGAPAAQLLEFGAGEPSITLGRLQTGVAANPIRPVPAHESLSGAHL